MNDELVEQLLSELSKTRESFDSVVKTIRWTRANTIIQYVLLTIVLIMGAVGVIYYADDKREQCERGNEFRVAISNSIDSNAAAIGLTLVEMTGSSPERFEEFLEVYQSQAKPEILEPREC
jgi:hypothetical protein